MSNASVRGAKRPALRLAVEGPIGVRTPAFPAAVLRDIQVAEDSRKALHDALNGDPDLLAVIAIASESLGAAARDWLAGSFDADDRVAMSLYAYVARSSMRATPFAACATIGTADVSERGEPLQCSELSVRARPDAEWLHAAGEVLERDPSTFERLEIRPSGLVHQIGGRLEVADVARAEVRSIGSLRSVVPIPTAFSATPAVAALLAACEPGMTVADLAARVAVTLGAAPRDVVELIAKLTSIGVFVTAGRPALGDRPAESLARAYRACSAVQAPLFDRFCSTLFSARGAALPQVPAILAASRNIAAEIAVAPHVAQVDAVRTYQGSLPQSLLDRLGAVIEKLAELSPQTRGPELLARGFQAKYNAGRFVPLLELLDPAEGLAYETLLAAPDPALDRIDAVLTELSMSAVAERTLAIALDDAVLAKLVTARGERSPAFRPPAYLEAIAALRSTRDGKLDVALTGRICEGRATSLGRFGDILAVPVPAADSGVIAAEFVGTSHLRRGANVANQSIGTDYVFTCGASSNRDRDHTITPSDVVVGCEDDRLVLRLRRSGMPLRVLFSHRLNSQFASRLAAFVHCVSLSDLVLVGLPWGAVSATLPFRPRFTIDGITVVPAQWRLPADIARDLTGTAGRAWRERWMLPPAFEIAESDNRLPVDSRCDIAAAYLRKLAGRASVLEATELVPSFADAVVAGPSGDHVAEIAVTYAVSGLASRERASIEPAHRVPPATAVNALRGPGSDWIFAKLYLGVERMNYFLESEWTTLAGFTHVADDWHFLRYADPEHHLRIRFRVENDARRTALVLDLYAWFERLVEARKLRRVAIDTYDREVERYGGPARIAIAERLFTADSAAVAPLLPKWRRGGSDFDAWLAADVTSFAIALTGSAANAKEMIRGTLPTRRKLPRESWETVRASRQLLDHQRYAGIASLANGLLHDLSPRAARDVASALLHMHCNRCGITGEGERHIRAVSAGICEGLIHERYHQA